MRLVVGLGNPGREYAKNRHNVGFQLIDLYAEAIKAAPFAKTVKFAGEFVKIGEGVLLKPRTFMNDSGRSVQAVASFYGITPKDILVLSDDLDLPFPKLRLREKGSAGGHNGLKSCIAHLGTQEFNRLRVGIDRAEDLDAKDYVLGNFSKAEQKTLKDLSATTNQIIGFFLEGRSFDSIMNDFNKK